VFGTSSGVKTPIDVYDFVGHEGARLINYMSYAADPACAKDLHHVVDLLSRGALHLHHAPPRSWKHAADAIGELRTGGSKRQDRSSGDWVADHRMPAYPSRVDGSACRGCRGGEGSLDEFGSAWVGRGGVPGGIAR